MFFYADLHIHSKYSRATSKDCNLEQMGTEERFECNIHRRLYASGMV